MNTFIKLSLVWFMAAINGIDCTNENDSLVMGDPVPGIDVSLEQIPGGKIVNTKTDEFGNYEFKNVAEGNYIIHIGKFPTVSNTKGEVKTVAHEAAHVVQQKQGLNKKANAPSSISIKEEGVNKHDRNSNEGLILFGKNYNSSRSNISHISDTSNESIPFIETTILKKMDFQKEEIQLVCKLMRSVKLIKGNVSK